MTDLFRYPGETLERYKARTGLDTWATNAQQRAENQRYIRSYMRENNSPNVVAQLEREWEAMDRVR